MAQFITDFNGRGYAACFSAIAATAAQDVFELVAPSTGRVAIKEVRLGQYTDFGDAEAEILSVLFLRGYTTSGSGGSTITPAALWSGHGASGSTVERNNTTVANTGTVVTLLADAWNIQMPFLWLPTRESGIILEASERFVVRITAPADSITLNGTLVFEER